MLSLDQSYEYGEHKQLPVFHHEEAHQQKPDAMNFRHSVTMITRPGQNNNKGRISPKRTKFNKNAIQMKPSYKMIAIKTL